MCLAVDEPSSGAQNSAPGESGSQIYSHKCRSEYAASCCVCAVRCGAVSGPVCSARLSGCLLPILYEVFALLRDNILSCAGGDRLSPSSN